MKATVMTTGPGVIIATATASRNCCSLSQWNLFTTPPCKNGTIASPLPKTKEPASAKYHAIVTSTPVPATPWIPEEHPRQERCSSAWTVPFGSSPDEHRDDTRRQKEPNDLRFGPGVATPLMAKMVQRSVSFERVSLTSLTTLRAMMAMTAAPMP